MTREEKAEIARRNGAKSKGPTTAQGKAASSRNGIKHGRYASSSLLSAVDRAVAAHEDPDRFLQLVRRNLEQFQPRSPLERDIAIALADTQWRYDRWNLSETKTLNEYHRSVDESYQEDLDDGDIDEMPPAEIDARAARALACRGDFLKRLTAERTRLIRETGAHLRLLRALRKEFPKPVKNRPDQTKVQTKDQTNVLHFPALLTS